MALWGNEFSPPVDADMAFFNEGDTQPQSPTRSVLRFVPFSNPPVRDQDPVTHWNKLIQLPLPSKPTYRYDLNRIDAVVIDEPYLKAIGFAQSGPLWQNPCHDNRFQAVLNAHQQLQALAQAVKVTTPTTRFWINFSEPEVQWMLDPNCPLNLSGPFVDVVSMDKYLVPFAGPCQVTLTQPASCVQPYYDWIVSHRASSSQQIAVLPGTFVRFDANHKQLDDPQKQADLLAGFFSYAMTLNQSCILPRESVGTTGRFDGCLVWVVMGFPGTNFQGGVSLWCGELESNPGVPERVQCPVSEVTAPIRRVWHAEFANTLVAQQGVQNEDGRRKTW